MLGKEIISLSKKYISYKFYQRISPSAKLMMLKHNINDFPTNIKFITKEVIINFMEKLEKDKTISRDTSSLWKESKQPISEKKVVAEEKVFTLKNILGVDNSIKAHLQSNSKAQGYMSIKIDLENTILDLKLNFSDSKLKSKSVEKLLNFTKRVAIKCSSNFKELKQVDFEKNSR